MPTPCTGSISGISCGWVLCWTGCTTVVPTYTRKTISWDTPYRSCRGLWIRPGLHILQVTDQQTTLPRHLCPCRIRVALLRRERGHWSESAPRGGTDLSGFYQILALKIKTTRHTFIHIGYNLQNFDTPNYLMLGLGLRLNNHHSHN